MLLSTTCTTCRYTNPLDDFVPTGTIHVTIWSDRTLQDEYKDTTDSESEPDPVSDSNTHCKALPSVSLPFASVRPVLSDPLSAVYAY